MGVKLIVQPGWQQTHVDLYLKTDGAEGHYLDLTEGGASADTPCLVLKVKGRTSGKDRLVPLIYGQDGDTYVVVGSNGASPTHPEWVLNLEADPNAAIQVASRKLAAVARVARGEERERLFAMMAGIYPPYNTMKGMTTRTIPVVVLEPGNEIASL